MATLILVGGSCVIEVDNTLQKFLFAVAHVADAVELIQEIIDELTTLRSAILHKVVVVQQ